MDPSSRARRDATRRVSTRSRGRALLDVLEEDDELAEEGVPLVRERIERRHERDAGGGAA